MLAFAKQTFDFLQYGLKSMMTDEPAATRTDRDSGPPGLYANTATQPTGYDSVMEFVQQSALYLDWAVRELLNEIEASRKGGEKDVDTTEEHS